MKEMRAQQLEQKLNTKEKTNIIDVREVLEVAMGKNPRCKAYFVKWIFRLQCEKLAWANEW